MKKLAISELEKVQELKKIQTDIHKTISILLAAINDWPNPIIELDEYETEVHRFVRDEVTKIKLELCLSQIDYSKNAWEAESLSQLIEVFHFYNEDRSLKEIIEDLKVKLEDENE